jgi:hypothetical protein
MTIWRDKEFSLVRQLCPVRDSIDFIQLLTILLLGFLSFAALFFFSALYLQELFGYSALMTAVCLLPTAVSGVVVNVSSQV